MPTFIATLIGLTILGFLLYLIFQFASLVYVISQSSPSVLAGLIAALSAVIGVVTTKYLEHRYNVIQDLRNRRAPVYERLIHMIMNMDKFSDNSDNIQKEFRKVAQGLSIWGSDRIIRLWSDFRSHSSSREGYEMLALFDEIMRQVRIDLGYKNTGIEDGDMLSMFINDMNEDKRLEIKNLKKNLPK